MDTMLQYHQITIADRDLVNRYMKPWQPESSGHCFTTLLIWGTGGRVCVAEEDGVLYLSACYAEHLLFVPFTEPARYPAALQRAAQDWVQRGREPVFYGVTAQFAPYFEAAGYSIIDDRNNYDYVYRAQDLITLKGKGYHGKRNHINYFLENYAYTYEPLTAQMKDECMAVYDEWQLDWEKDETREREAVETALTHFDALGLAGGAIRVDGKLAAFTIGERLREDTALIHIEKAVDLRGAFPLINREFLRHAFADVTFVNREEDMGLSGLRAAKESYLPVRMIEKRKAKKP